MTTITRVVGIDPSLTSTGIAVIDLDEGSIWTRTHISRPSGSDLADRNRRIRQASTCITSDIGGDTLVAIETPAYGSRQGSQHDRSGLWWRIVDHCSLWALATIEVSPASRAMYATGRGNAPKDHVLAQVLKRYSAVDVNGFDEADALILAAIGARTLGRPIEESMPATHLRAMDKLKLPEGLGCAA